MEFELPNQSMPFQETKKQQELIVFLPEIYT
jgi:hypothetical protein